LKPLPNKIVVGTSAGIDSASLVVAGLDIGKEVTVSSFTLSDRQSNDFKGAKRLADHFGLDFMPVQIPVDPDTILSRVFHIIRTLTHPDTNYELKLKKTTIECILPWLFLMSDMKKHGHTNLVTGIGADSHFALSKRAMIHYREPQEKFQEFRTEYFGKPDAGQSESLPIFGNQYGVHITSPYFEQAVFDIYKNATWHELNKPRQKETVRREYPEVDGICENKHVNFQLGDSGIAALIGEVTRSRVAPKAKSPVKAYNILQNRGRAGML
jgi:NH3-dependent NAD+ synthetase